MLKAKVGGHPSQLQLQNGMNPLVERDDIDVGRGKDGQAPVSDVLFAAFLERASKRTQHNTKLCMQDFIDIVIS